MPAILKVKIIEARDLPVMDSLSESTDAFVEVKFHNEYFKTNICRKSLCPKWNSNFRFEVEDAEIQNDVLELKVYDYDSYSTNDAIGKVYISLSPLSLINSIRLLKGWHPIYDTLRGIRGELNVLIELEIFNNENKYRDASIGVRILALTEFPSYYKKIIFHSFIEELVVSTDPEYQWVDSFRSSRASNDARVRLLYRISGALKRKLGLKALNMGGNAIIGYQQNFDTEGEYGIVARGIGTVVSLMNFDSTFSKKSEEEVQTLLYRSLTKDSSMSCTELFYSDNLLKPWLTKTTPKQSVPFFTLNRWSSNLIKGVGGIVTARSVKLLNKIKEPEEPETRDVWWEEIREEIMSHAKALGCNTVIGYNEHSSIYDELCVLSATGTAAILSFLPFKEKQSTVHPEMSNSTQFHEEDVLKNNFLSNNVFSNSKRKSNACQYNFAHVRKNSSRFTKKTFLCQSCKKKEVPEVFFTNFEFIEGSFGHNVMFLWSVMDSFMIKESKYIEAKVCRAKKKLQGENNALAVSEALPFIEFDIHQQLLNKLKLISMNAIIKLSIQISIGETLITAVAVGSAIFLECLSSPIQIKPSNIQNNFRFRHSLEIKSLEGRNSELIQSELSPVLDSFRKDERTSSIREGMSEDNQRSIVLELEDEIDEKCISTLIEPNFCSTVQFSTLQYIYGIGKETFLLQMITSLQSFDLISEFPINKNFSLLFDEIKQRLCFKFRRYQLSTIADLKYTIEMNNEKEDRIQVLITGMLLGIRKTCPFGTIQESMHQLDWIGENDLVHMTTMNFIPGFQLINDVGPLEIFLIKENEIRESDSASDFIHVLVMEAYGIARAHARSFGANAILAMKFGIIDSNTNEGYVVIMLSGDLAIVR